MPIITFRWPSIKAWIAASPSRLARYAVIGTRSATPLQMAQDRNPDIISGIFLLYPVGVIHGTSILVFRTFGHNYDAAVFRLSESTSDECFQLVHVRPVFRNDGRFSTGSYCAVLCQEARITPPSPRQRKCGRARWPYPGFCPHTPRWCSGPYHILW